DAGTGLPANSFAGLTADKLKAALNGTTPATDYAGITGTTLDALTGSALTAQTYTGFIQTGKVKGQAGTAVLVIENDDNLGEYALYHLIWNTDPTANANREFTTVNLIGVMDFGSSVNFTTNDYTTFNGMDGVLL
ncbi:MAG: hypothetical protein ACRC2U_10585, partial [Aeromonas sp.]